MPPPLLAVFTRLLKAVPLEERKRLLRKAFRSKKPDIRIFNPKEANNRFAELAKGEGERRVSSIKKGEGDPKDLKFRLREKPLPSNEERHKPEWASRYRLPKASPDKGFPVRYRGYYRKDAVTEKPQKAQKGEPKAEGLIQTPDFLFKRRVDSSRPGEYLPPPLAQLLKVMQSRGLSKASRDVLGRLLKARRKGRGEKFAPGAMSPADLIRGRRGSNTARKSEPKVEGSRGLLEDYKKKVRETREKQQMNKRVGGDPVGKVPLNPGRRPFSEIMESKKRGEPLNLTERGVVRKSKKMNNVSNKDRLLLEQLGPEKFFKISNRKNFARRKNLVGFMANFQKKNKVKLEGSRGRLPSKEEMDGITQPGAMTEHDVEMDRKRSINKQDRKFRRIPGEREEKAARDLDTLRSWELRRQDRAAKKQSLDAKRNAKEDLYDPVTGTQGDARVDLAEDLLKAQRIVKEVPPDAQSVRDIGFLEKARNDFRSFRDKGRNQIPGKSTPAGLLPDNPLSKRKIGDRAETFEPSSKGALANQMAVIPGEAATETVLHRKQQFLEEGEKLEKAIGPLLYNQKFGDKGALEAKKMASQFAREMMNSTIFDGVEGIRAAEDMMEKAPLVMRSYRDLQSIFLNKSVEKLATIKDPERLAVAEHLIRSVKQALFHTGTPGKYKKIRTKFPGEEFAKEYGKHIPDLTPGVSLVKAHAGNKALNMLIEGITETHGTGMVKKTVKRELPLDQIKKWVDRADDAGRFAEFPARPAGNKFATSPSPAPSSSKLPRSVDPNDGPAQNGRDVEQVRLPKDRAVFDPDGNVVQQGEPLSRWKQEGPGPEPLPGDLPETDVGKAFQGLDRARSSNEVKPLALEMLARDLGMDTGKLKEGMLKLMARAKTGNVEAKKKFERLIVAFKDKQALAMRGPRPTGGGDLLDENGKPRL